MEASRTAMQLIRKQAFVTTPWKNGGGVTHEIARQDRGGRMVWRLSIAEVDRDGAFSLFEGMERILTVIAGPGMDLVEVGSGETRAALLDRPIHFSGDSRIEGRLPHGPCRDFNLIYDPSQVTASVSVHNRPFPIKITDHATARTGLYCISGRVHLHGTHELESGNFCFLGPEDEETCLAPEGRALLVTITSR